MRDSIVSLCAVLALTTACAPRASQERPVAPALTTEAPRLDAAAPAATTQAQGTRLYELTAAPPNEQVDGRERPSCTTVSEDDVGKPLRIVVDGRTLELEWQPDMQLAVTEGKHRVWTGDFGHASPIAATFCARDGWHVVLAGEGRGGYALYDVFTGKKVERADDLIVDPTGSWAIVPPAWSWGMACFATNRPFRVPLTASGPTKWLDTPARPVSSLCDSRDRDADEHVDALSMAISPDGELYAYVDPYELSIFRTADDVKVASLPNPPVEADQRFVHDPHLLSFSRSGRFLVLETGGDRPTEPVWFEIERGT